MANSMRALGVASTLVLVAAAAVGPARADSMTAADILSNFNLVTTGNVSTQSDIVGDAVVGGDLSGATFFGGSHVPASPTLYVFGKLNSSLNLNSGGSLYYAGGSSPKVNYNGGGKHYTTLPNPLGNYTDPLTDLSAQLANLTATSGTSLVNGKFNAGSNTGVVVFEMTGAELASDLVNHDISFAGNGVTSYIINVIGDFTERSSTHFNVDQEDALFNFEDATKVNLGQWGASILAPDAGGENHLGRQYRGFAVRRAIPRRRRTAQQQSLQRRAPDDGACDSAGPRAVDLGDADRRFRRPRLPRLAQSPQGRRRGGLRRT